MEPRPLDRTRKHLSEGSPCPTVTGYGYVRGAGRHTQTTCSEIKQGCL